MVNSKRTGKNRRAVHHEIRNEQRFLRVNRRRVAALVGRVLAGECSAAGSVNVLVTDDARIRRLNRKFLNHDRRTDVIAFGGRTRGVPGPERGYLGDVVISAETARREGPRYGQTPAREFERYVVHGILHLLGYRDKRPADFRRMRKKQEFYLEKTDGGRFAKNARVCH